MDVTFTRTGERRYGVFVERPGYPSAEMDPAPSYDDELPHDFVHFVVEEELGLELGVFGQLAAGGDASTFRIVPATSDRREASRTRRRQQNRGKRLSEEGHEQAEFSERAATICHEEWFRRFPTRGRLTKIRKLQPFVEKVRGECSRDELDSLSEPVIERICDRLERLSACWSKIDIGESLTLRWSPSEKGSGRRSA